MKNLFISLTLFVLLIPFNAWPSYNAGVIDTIDGVSFPAGLDFNNIPNFDSAVGDVTIETGVNEHDDVASCKVIVNAGDDSKVDIEGPCHVHIGGPHYSFTNLTAIDPELGAGENSKFIGITMNGYTTAASDWTTAQKLTVIPLARLNTAYGVSGPGSTISLIRDDRWFSSNRNHYNRLWHEKVMGAMYVSGGEIEATGLVLSQTAGVLFDGQTKEHELSAFANMSAVFLHLSSNEINWVGNKQPLVIDNINYNPPGSSLVSLSTTNKYKIDTVLKSPKGSDGVPEGGWFVIAGAVEYDTIEDALAAIENGTAIRWGLFVNQGVSGLVQLALIVQNRDATTIDLIKDVRPCRVCRPY